MKNFEKWWNNSVRIYIHNPKDKEILKCGYKVALEWVSSLYEKYDLEDWDTVACNIKQDIKKELSPTEQQD